jgi:hypothetical protein
MVDKAELIAGLQEEYRNWQALLDRIGPQRMDQPGVAGFWSVKDIVAHLTGWRNRTVTRLQAAQRGELDPPPPWPARLQTDDEINAWIYEANYGRSVQEILDESHQVFQQLLAAIQRFPAEILEDPARRPPWLGDQPITAAMFFAHFHEEHEPDMLAWLARVEKE